MTVSRIRSAAAAAIALAALVACAGQKPGEPFGTLSTDEVEKLVGKPDVLVVDANPEDVFKKNHVPGAVWYRSAPIDKLLPAEKDRTLVFYCASPT